MKQSRECRPTPGLPLVGDFLHTNPLLGELAPLRRGARGGFGQRGFIVKIVIFKP
jgi:hypothetical protein